MLYFDRYTKKVVGCDLKVSGGMVAKHCSDCNEDCRIRELLVMEVNWNLPETKASATGVPVQGSEHRC
jgi:hypothetical protein